MKIHFLSILAFLFLTLKVNAMSTDTTGNKKNMVLTRVFNVSPERLWKAWSDGELVKRWWGPKAFTAPIANMDFREGGSTLVCMRTPDGHDMYNTWNYTKIVPYQRIEYVLNFSDKNGKTVEPASLGLPPGIPRDVPHVITFKDLGNGKTELSVTEYGYASEPIADMSKAGMAECLDKMELIFKK